MRLQQIEDAFKGDFVWSKSKTETKILQCNAEIEGSTDTALIVFCGLSEMYGFESKQTARSIPLLENEYYRLLKIFRVKIMAAYERIKAGEWDNNKNDLVQKIWTKTRLIQNKL